jgi:hypothetical protein
VVFAAYVWEMVDGDYGVHEPLKRGVTENAKKYDAVLWTSVVSHIFYHIFFCHPGAVYPDFQHLPRGFLDMDWIYCTDTDSVCGVGKYEAKILDEANFRYDNHAARGNYARSIYFVDVMNIKTYENCHRLNKRN